MQYFQYLDGLLFLVAPLAASETRLKVVTFLSVTKNMSEAHFSYLETHCLGFCSVLVLKVSTSK